MSSGRYVQRQSGEDMRKALIPQSPFLKSSPYNTGGKYDMLGDLSLTLSMLGKFHQTTFRTIFLMFLENRHWHFMQIVSLGDNLQEMSKSIFWEN